MVGDKGLLLWMIHLLPLAFPEMNEEEEPLEEAEEEVVRPEITIATGSESLLRAKKKYNQ